MIRFKVLHQQVQVASRDIRSLWMIKTSIFPLLFKDICGILGLFYAWKASATWNASERKCCFSVPSNESILTLQMHIKSKLQPVFSLEANGEHCEWNNLRMSLSQHVKIWARKWIFELRPHVSMVELLLHHTLITVTVNRVNQRYLQNI